MTSTKAHTGRLSSDDLVDQGLAALQSAHQIALSAVRTGLENLRSYAPEIPAAISKVDGGDARRLVDSAFETTSRVVTSNRAFVSDLLASVLESPKPAGTKSA